MKRSEITEYAMIRGALDKMIPGSVDGVCVENADGDILFLSMSSNEWLPNAEELYRVSANLDIEDVDLFQNDEERERFFDLQKKNPELTREQFLGENEYRERLLNHLVEQAVMGVALTTKDVAEILGISESGVCRMIYSGKLPAQKFGKAWVIKPIDLKKITVSHAGRPRKSNRA